jgi:hypothetical protein
MTHSNDHNCNVDYHLSHNGTIRYESSGNNPYSGHKRHNPLGSTYVLLPLAVIILIIVIKTLI